MSEISTMSLTASVDGSTEVAPSSSRTDPALVELFEVFGGPLREVAFPDVSLEVLHGLRDEAELALIARDDSAEIVAAAEQSLAEAERALSAAREALRDAETAVDERQRALLVRAQRALSYAKVFAETDPALHARLSAISLSRIAQRKPSVRESRPRALTLGAEPAANEGAPRKRGRPRKVDPTLVAASG